MTGADPLPEGIHPAAQCSVSAVLRRPHAPHLWAWNQASDRDPSRVVQPGEAAPDGTRWCDGGVPGGER